MPHFNIFTSTDLSFKEEISASKFNVNMRAQFGLNFFLTQLLPEDVI